MLDKQEKQIIRALIRNPRRSDNRIRALTGVPVRTVSRKRARLEQEGIIAYYTGVDTQSTGSERAFY
ncbi:MAG: DNA-binding Lrp family transcriptional regulator, partial [Candidatus Latescibacterota bacterium]